MRLRRGCDTPTVLHRPSSYPQPSAGGFAFNILSYDALFGNSRRWCVPHPHQKQSRSSTTLERPCSDPPHKERHLSAWGGGEQRNA